ncbi:MAG: VWA domain-containing protein [Firmicutes bacterium]|nr:VWA domain-containing protein [Bacillota bacterium]
MTVRDGGLSSTQGITGLDGGMGRGTGAAAGMDWVEKVAAHLHRGEGVRFGEAAVVSRRVHLMDPAVPEEVVVLGHADAGQVFYGRRDRDRVLHIDLFHQVGPVDHRRVAAAVRRVLSQCGQPDLAHYVDVQTSTGGGRVTGDLTYGTRPSLRAAHRNHIHLAAEIGDGGLPLLYPLILALEEEVLAQGLEIRRVDRLRGAPAGRGAVPLDMSDYTDVSDSLLREPGTSPAAGEPGAPGPGGGGAPGGDPGARGGRVGPRGTVPEDALEPGAGPEPAGVPWPVPVAAAEERLQAVLALSRRIGSPDELKRTLDLLRAGRPSSGGLSTGVHAPYLLRELEAQGLIYREGRAVRLTPAGLALAEYFDRHLREVKLRFRKRIRRVPRGPLPTAARLGDRPSPAVRYGPVRGVVPVAPGQPIAHLAVPETVVAGIRRTYLERAQAQQGPGSRPPEPPARAQQDPRPQPPEPRTRNARPGRLTLERRDLHVYTRAGDQPLYLCLLIDASASMAGRRILAAKHLVRHLLTSTRDRIAVVAFQERDVRVHVPFTRDWGRVEEGLARIQPMGLTPMAHGLTGALELIRDSRVRRPLVLLITDGIPTVPKWGLDPLADALEAARQVARSRVPFGCIGLMPSRRYLEDLARAAGGTLHVVEELDEEALVRIAHRERLRCRSRR